MTEPIDALCDWTALAQAPADLPQLIKLYREALRSANTTLTQRFHDGLPADSLVHQRAALIDRILRLAWHRLVDADTAMPLALVAVGGYGRGELHPGSDIDLLILLDTHEEPAHVPLIERFLVFLWDIGLEVGHSVRSVAECAEQAAGDITIATNLMEARLLCGPATLFRAMQAGTGPAKVWPSRDFFQAKRREQTARHQRYHDTGYNLEPNVKESPGGLRDLQVIGWVAKRHFGVTTLHDLVAHGFLTEAEYATLVEHQNFLWRVRIGLHTLTGRREDRLLFDHQRRLADLFGYQSAGHGLAVEQFMKQYYRTVMDLSRLNEMLLQLFEEEILGADPTAEPMAINRRFQARGGFIEASYPTLFKRYPFALLEVFLLLAQHPELKGVRAGTIRLIRDHRYLIDDQFRNDLRCKSLFMELFRQPAGLTHELRRMNRYGVLAAYLPVFGNIVGQMQHDLFHVYTVDEHTMFVVRNLRRFTVPEFRNEFPLCSALVQHIPKPELLYLAGFFHDMAKGRGGDHSDLGARDVMQFCQAHGVSTYDSNLVAWLVRHHLMMSTTAQRKDISDPEVIQAFAATMGTQHRLDYLFLLTVADIRATSPTLWNSWKDALLTELYQSTTRALRRGLANPVDAKELARDTRTLAQALLAEQGVDADSAERVWQTLDEDYFLRHSAEEVAWHTYTLHGATPENLPLVQLRSETRRGGSALFVYARDHQHLFAVITSALARLGLNVTDARIFTATTNYALDTFILLEKNGDPIHDPQRAEEIQTRVRSLLLQSQAGVAVDLSFQSPLPRQLKHFPIATEISFREDAHNHRTVMDVVAGDRPGLLALIAKGLLHCNARLQTAKIATLGERAEDTFFITDLQHQPLRDEPQFDCLRHTLSTLLG